MKKLLILFFFAMLGGVFALAAVYNAPEQNAKKLYQKASDLVKSASEKEAESYREALVDYNTAASIIDELIQKYPDTDVAKQILSEETLFELYTHKQLTQEVIDDIFFKAKAEEHPLDCALVEVQKIKDNSQMSKALIYVAGQFYKSGNQEKNKLILDQAFDVAGRLDSYHRMPPFIKDFKTPMEEAAIAFAQSGDFEKALEAVHYINEPFYKASAMIETALLLNKAGEKNKALSLVDESVTFLDDDALYFDNIFALCKVSKAYIDLNQMDTALEILQNAEKQAHRIGFSQNKIIAMMELASVYAKLNRKDVSERILEQACEIAQKTQTPSDKSLEIYIIAGKFAEIGDFDRAYQLACEQDSFSEKAKTLTRIAEKIEETHKHKKRSYLDEALNAANDIESLNAKLFTLLFVADGFFKSGWKDHSLNILNQVLKELEYIDNNDIKDSIITEAVIHLSQWGEAERAEETASLYSTPIFHSLAYSAAARSYSKNGMITESLAAAKKVADPYERVKVLADISEHWQNSNEAKTEDNRKILHEIIHQLSR